MKYLCYLYFFCDSRPDFSLEVDGVVSQGGLGQSLLPCVVLPMGPVQALDLVVNYLRELSGIKACVGRGIPSELVYQWVQLCWCKGLVQAGGKERQNDKMTHRHQLL